MSIQTLPKTTKAVSRIDSERRRKLATSEPETSAELLWKILTDEAYYLETCCQVKHIKHGSLVPFKFNIAQKDFYEKYWLPNNPKIIMPKPRKMGFSTQIIGLGSHAAQYTEGLIFRLVAHNLNTAIELNKTVKLLYDQAWGYFESLGERPEYYLPIRNFDDKEQTFFKKQQSAIIVETARAAGVGQSDRTDILYLTEYAHWHNAKESYKGLKGSMPMGGANNRIIIDFNANGIGNDAYDKYQAAKRGESGFTPVFYGIYDCPDVYEPEFIKQEQIDLSDDFPAVYPSNDEELWLKSDKAVFNWGDIVECRDDRYFCDVCPTDQLRTFEYFHGVDTASGRGDGDWQVMKGFALVEGTMWEAYPPIRTRIPEDVFAGEVDRIARLFPGVLTVEMNFGEAVMIELRNLQTPGLARFKRSRAKAGKQKREYGFWTSENSKRTMIKDLQRSLRDGDIILVSENGRTELRQFEWQPDKQNEDTQKLAGAPQGKHDDEAMATMLALQGLKQKPVELVW